MRRPSPLLSLVCFTLALAWAAPVRADMNEAKTLYAQGDFTAAAEQLRQEAEKGLAEAQRLLAQLYETGQGVKANESVAWTWYRKAAILGDVEAMYRLGRMHETGLGVPQSYQEALRWYQRAARLGHGPSKARLGRFYLEGKGAKTNVTQGVVHIREAAMLGEAEAEALLEDLSRKGLAAALPPPQMQPPADADAAAILDEIEKFLSGYALAFGGTPFISGSGPGPWTVTLPRAEYRLDEASRWQIGTLRVTVTKSAPELREYRIVLPSRSRVTGPKGQTTGTLTLSRNVTTLVWSTRLEAPVRSEIDIEGIKLADPSPGAYSFEMTRFSGRYALVAAAEGSRHESSESGAVSGLRLREKGQEVLSIGRLELTSALKGLDLAGYKEFRRNMGRDPSAGPLGPETLRKLAQSPDLIPALIGGMSFQLSVKDVRVAASLHSAASSLSGFSFGLAGDDLDQPLSRLSGNVSLDGLAIGDKEVKPLAPKSLALRLTAEKLPLRDMTNQALASLFTLLSETAAPKRQPGERGTATQTASDLAATMADAAIDAQSTLKLDQLEAKGAEYDLDATGEFRLERKGAGSFSGNLQARLRGLDRLTGPDAEANLITGLFVALRGFGQGEPDAQGRETFDVRFLPTGEVMVNGKLWPGGRAEDDNAPVPLKPPRKAAPKKSQSSKP